MYAVIRTGGKQYRVAPGDVVKIESVVSDENQTIEFSDVLRQRRTGNRGQAVPPQGDRRSAGRGRGEKILVFHLKRKKQYKKLQGHRQNFTEVRIKAMRPTESPIQPLEACSSQLSSWHRGNEDNSLTG